MKITPPVPKAIQHSNRQTMNASDFETILHRDDFYHNHRPLWEQSQLHFDAQKTEHGPNNQSDETPHNTHPVESNQDPIPTQAKTSTAPSTRCAPMAAAANRALPLETTLSTQKGTINPPISALLETRTRLLPNESQQTTSIMPHKSVRQAVLKNHHVFTHEQGIDLALGQIHLTLQQRRDLIKRVKQFLSEQGISLAKLIINGEQQ